MYDTIGDGGATQYCRRSILSSFICWPSKAEESVELRVTKSWTELEAFLPYIDELILLTIPRYTNRKVNDLRHAACVVRSFMSPFTLDEIKTATVILLSARTDRDNFCCVRDLSDPVEGRPFYRVVMSINRFKFFICAIRFDNYRDRAARLQNDRLVRYGTNWCQICKDIVF